MALGHHVEPLQVGVAGRADFDAVGFRPAGGHEVDAHFAFGAFDGGVDFARRDVEALGKILEVVDERFHARLHFIAAGRADFEVLDFAGLAFQLAFELVEALVDEADTLLHFFHAHEVAVVAVAVFADGDVEVEFIVALVRLGLAEVERIAAAAQHGAGEAPLLGLLGRDHADADRALLPDAVFGEQILQLGESFFAEIFVPGTDFGGEAFGQVTIHPARAEVVGVHARAGDFFGKVEGEFALFKGVEHDGHCADIERVAADPQQVVGDAGDFGHQHPDVLRAFGHADAKEFFDGEAPDVLLAHHADVIEPIEIRQRLDVGFILDELFGTAVEQADVRVGFGDHFAVELQHQAQHAVGGRVLRAEVEGEGLAFGAGEGCSAGDH